MARRKGLTFYQKKKKLNIALMDRHVNYSGVAGGILHWNEDQYYRFFYGTQSVQWTGDFPEQAGL